MDSDYENLRSLIRALKLNGNDTFDASFETHQSDKRTLSIKAFVYTESIYLQRITELLTTMFYHLDNNFNNLLRSPIASKEEVTYLLFYFPRIYSLHISLSKRLRNDVNLAGDIGDLLFEFLCQSRLLDTYEKYITRISRYLSIAKMIETKSYAKDSALKDLNHIIMSPVQRFPQLSLAIGDIYKNTPDSHRDKVKLFKSWSLARSITLRLDRRRRNCEQRDFKDIYRSLAKLKLCFSSTKLLSNISVYELKTNFHTNDKVIKIPYNLILCDRNVIMLRKDLAQNKLSTKVVYSFNVNEIDFQQYKCPTYNSLTVSDISADNIEQLKCFYRAKTGTNLDDSLLNEYSKILHDFSFLFNLSDDIKRLHFSYSDIDKSINLSLLELAPRLKEKEKELNTQMSSITILNRKTPEPLSGKRYILFESTKQANEWIIEFNRAKLLSDTQLSIDWLYYSAGGNFEQMCDSDLPLVFQPFSIKNHITDTIEPVIVKCHLVNVVLGTKVCRCLWLCLANGWIMILHFDYRQWKLLERFQVDINGPISDLCEVTEFDSESKQIVDSEIWMASGDCVFIYSLFNNQNSEIKSRFQFQTAIKSLCTIDSKVLVGLVSNIIMVFGKTDDGLIWVKEKEVSLVCLQKPNEEIDKIIYSDPLVYVIYGKKVITLEKCEYGFLEIKNKFESEKSINALSPTTDAVWIAFKGQNSLILYDKYLNNIFNVISLPSIFLPFPQIGNVTSIHANEKYIWLGTENGLIIAIANIDSLHCVDSNLPMYFCSKYATGAITQLIPFQNIQSTSAKNKTIDEFDQRSQHQEIDILSEQEINTQFNTNIDISQDDSKDETDALSESSLETVYNNWKYSTLTLLLAFGTGTAHDDSGLERETANHDQSTIFTYFE